MDIEGLDDGALPDVLELLREAILTEMRVALPGTITSYDEETRNAEVLPLIMRKSFDAQEAIALPIIPNVPVVHPQTQKGALILPVSPGDPVTLIISDRSLEDWKASSGTLPTEAVDKRKHDLSDCWAIPGGWPDALPFAAASSGNLALQVTSGTKIYIGNGTDELLQIAHDAFSSLKTLAEKLNDTLTNIQALTVTSNIIPPFISSVPINSPLFLATGLEVTAIILEIDAELSSLDNIKA